MVYHGSNQLQLEYDFVVAPGTDPNRIRLHVEGADSLSINHDGDLVMRTTAGDVIEHAPVVYQVMGTQRRPISGKYVLSNKDDVAFRLPKYDRGNPVVIDPVLTYGTFVGGNNNDIGEGITVDSSGAAYITGFTQSTDFPTTAGAFQTSNISQATFVIKLNAGGTALDYSTYLGTCEAFAPSRIAVDTQGDAYITGVANGCIPTTPGSYAPTLPPNDGGEAFVTKLTPDGSALSYSTYLLGGTVGKGIAVDQFGSAYVTGWADGNLFPITPGAFAALGGVGAFVTKLSSDGSSLIYSAMIGGQREQALGFAIAVDSTGNAYITGEIVTPNPPLDFPITTGAFQPGFAGGQEEAFATALSASGSQLLYSTFIGGSSEDEGLAIAVDSSGNAHIAGRTFSADFPTTPGAYQTTGTLGDSSDDATFVVKLNNSGAAVYSTYLRKPISGSSEGITEPVGISVDSVGHAVIAGNTANFGPNFPTSPDSTFVCNGFDLFLSELSLSGGSLLSSSCLPTAAHASIAGSAFDSAGNSYLVGTASCAYSGTTPGAFQTTCNSGDENAFVWKLAPSPASAITSNDSLADAILGQTTFGPGGINADNGTLGVSASGVNFPSGIAVDTSVTPNRLYAADSVNHRILGWPNVASFINGAPATLVIGQPDFVSNTANNGGPSAASLNYPTDVAVDSSGNLWVADQGNNRVLKFNTPFSSDTVADRVLGQPDFVTIAPPAATSASTLLAPTSVALDKSGNVYVADGASRVLEYNAPAANDPAANRVYGQPDMVSSLCNNGGIGANTLCGPLGSVKLDSNGKLYIADSGNNRVLIFNTPTTKTTADLVIGAQGSFNDNYCAVTNGQPTDAINLCNPTGLAIDKANRLYVADSGENRILRFNPPLASGESATAVFGQPDFVSNPPNNGAGFGAASLNDPQGLALDATGDLFAADGANNRILKYKQVLPAAASLSVTSLNFGAQIINTASAAKAVKLTNVGGAALSISAITASGDFGQTNTCPASLAPNKNCTISVTFTPTATGKRAGTLTITDNALDSPQTVALSGSGLLAVSVTPTKLNFGTVTTGTTSAPIERDGDE